MDEIGVSSLIGKRPTMEDEHLIFRFNSKVILYAIFDGHGGSTTCKMAKEILTELISTHLKPQTDIKKELIWCFIELDKRLYNIIKDASGSTVVLILRIKNKLYIANLGDSRCVIFNKSGKILLETKDHKPLSENERIVNNGGQVIYGRVNGSLSVSRALGDFSEGLKLNNEKYRGIYAPVSCLPDIYTLDLSEENIYAILACDGLWDVSSSKDVVNGIVQSKKLKNLQELADSITHTTINILNSTDNVSCILLKFNLYTPDHQ